GLLITGTNMSGKTAFLRTLGVTAVLAQTIYTCPASCYSAPFFRVISSINEQDDLLQGKSLYLVEAERLLKMIRSSEGDGCTLCIMDEPLGGTNSSDRLAATSAILRPLMAHGGVVAIATHDVELAEELKGHATCYHFLSIISVDGVGSDFTLRKGISYN